MSFAYKLVAVVGEVSNVFDFHWRDFVCDLILSAVAKLVDMVRQKEIALFIFLPFIFWMEEISWAHHNKIPNVLGQSRLGLQQINELSFRFIYFFGSFDQQDC